MHILIAHNDYGTFSGEEESIDRIASVMIAHGHHVSWYRRSSVEVSRSFRKKIDAFFAGIYSIESKRCMTQILDQETVDLVQVQNLYPFISPSILPVCKAKHLPVVMRCPNYRLLCPNGLHLSHGNICERCLGGKEWNCVLQNCEEDMFKSIGYAARNAFARITHMILDNVTTFIVLSEFQKARFINGGIPSNKIEVLPNMAPKIELESAGSIGDTISFAGRISREKGIINFIDAARKLPHLQFSVAGSNHTLTHVLKDSPANVFVEGFLSGKAFDVFYEDSRIIVIPSICLESFPNVITKAMAHGKPVIASRIGAIPEIVDDGVTGLLFTPGNVSELTEKIDYLWNRPRLCREMGVAALLKAKAEFSEQIFYDRLINIYKTALHLHNQ